MRSTAWLLDERIADQAQNPFRRIPAGRNTGLPGEWRRLVPHMPALPVTAKE
jgi:hypothetical protein